METLDLKAINKEFINQSPVKVIENMLGRIGSAKIALASSLSIEDQVLTDMLLKIDPKARIFFIDTGRHFQKTYDLMQETMNRYGFHYEVYAPESEDLEALIAEHGPNLFYESVELRKKCCDARKVKPLQRVLKTVEAWICGLRREQSLTRDEIDPLEWDGNYSIYKVNPIALWNEEQVWDYIRKENVPYSNLYQSGFRSIGCEPCTRVVKPGEDVRSGRWWWESPDKKECGLHPVKR
ncbi:MAG: phosphoadenosine phosphosulfate reductase [Gracilibacter sp. BRH_c7a]|nr:MAG: phosphoadenosine phosphosulfate reductase [Gracilibacter sp. BRH_c7a]